MEEGKKKHIRIGPYDALVIVDLQNDFCEPDGALAVSGSARIIPIVNQLIAYFSVRASQDGWDAGIIVATKDWHPSDHSSFKEQGGPWPAHCVQDTAGSDFHPDLDEDHVQEIFYKGYDRSQDNYSGFEGTVLESEYGEDAKGESLESFLKRKWIGRIFVVGLATDYCVKATVLDGVKLGFEVYVVGDAIAAVNVNPDDGEKALQEMVDAGAKLCTSRDILHNGDDEEECDT